VGLSGEGEKETLGGALPAQLDQAGTDALEAQLAEGE